MAVVINSGAVAADDLLRDVPRERWHELMLARRRFLEVKLSYDCRCLVQFVNEASEMYEALGFGSVNDMVREGYGLEPEEIKVAVEWLELNPPDEPLALEVVLAKRGRPPKGKGKGRNPTIAKRGKAYDLARLRRDRPDLAARVDAGELSANAATIEAGFRKKLTSLEQIQRLWRKLNKAERYEHLRWTEQQCATCGRSGATNGMWCDACCDEGIAETARADKNADL